VKAITAVRALDDRTVEIATRRPAATLLAQLAYVPIVPRDSPLSPITRPVGTGPYRFVRGRPYGTFEGERFEGYWGAKPLFRRFRYVPIESPAEQARWVEDGLADVAVFVPRSLAAGRRDEAWRVVPGRPVINLVLGMAQWPGAFGDRRCRQAVALSIDRSRLARADPDRLLSPQFRLVPAGVLGSAPAPPAAADAAAARRLLSEAGHPGGLDVSLLIYEGDLPIGRELAAELAAGGIRARLRSLPRQEYFRALSDRSDALYLFNWVPEWGDAAQLLDGFLHSRDGAYGEHNFLFNGDAEFDRLIEAADRMLEAPARILALEQAVRYAQRDVPVVPLLVESRLAAVRRDLDFTPRSDGVIRAFDLRRR
jgi:peptide/nickel transport system substrate-binding protein